MAQLVPPEDDELRGAYQKYTNIAFLRRGLIINEVILLERIIDDYLIEYFCQDQTKQRELRELIICTNRMIFENKLQVFKVLIEKHNSSFFASYPKFMADIKEIIEERNIFAHYWLVTSSDMQTWVEQKMTVFVKFKNITEYIQYGELDVQRLMELVNKYIRACLTLQK